MDYFRFYHNPLEKGRIQIEPSESRHFLTVLRGTAGQKIELFDGQGTLAVGEVCQVKKNAVFVDVIAITKTAPRVSNRIILATAAAKGQRFDWMLSKCTELGADHIALVNYERSVRLGKESAIGRYTSLTIAACKQCKRLFLPTISAPKQLIDAITDLKNQYPNAEWCVGRPECQTAFLNILPKEGRDVVVFVGPEGGFTEQEISLLEQHGAISIRIASHILRTETAAIAFSALFDAFRANQQS